MNRLESEQSSAKHWILARSKNLESKLWIFQAISKFIFRRNYETDYKHLCLNQQFSNSRSKLEQNLQGLSLRILFDRNYQMSSWVCSFPIFIFLSLEKYRPDFSTKLLTEAVFKCYPDKLNHVSYLALEISLYRMLKLQLVLFLRVRFETVVFKNLIDLFFRPSVENYSGATVLTSKMLSTKFVFIDYLKKPSRG